MCLKLLADGTTHANVSLGSLDVLSPLLEYYLSGFKRYIADYMPCCQQG